MNALFDLLAAPGTLAPLKLQEGRKEGRKELVEQNTVSPRSFPIRNNVPDFLAEQVQKTTLIADGPHAGKSFDYLDHYAKDADFFDYFALPADAATLHENLRLHETILRQLPKTAATILDLGCGGAWLARATLPLGHRIVSFDAAGQNTAQALRNNPSPRHFAVTGDALSLPFKTNAFDVVVSAEVIEHVAEVKAYLDGIVRVLKPGGRAIISTPYDETIQHSLCIHCNRPTPLHAHAHLRSFREDSLNKYVTSRGDIRVRTIVFSSKVLLLLRTHVLLKHLPHRAWRLVDKLANKVINKPSRLVYVIDKSEPSASLN